MNTKCDINVMMVVIYVASHMVTKMKCWEMSHSRSFIVWIFLLSKIKKWLQIIILSNILQIKRERSLKVDCSNLNLQCKGTLECHGLFLHIAAQRQVH